MVKFLFPLLLFYIQIISFYYYQAQPNCGENRIVGRANQTIWKTRKCMKICSSTFMLTLESWRFPVLGEVSFCIETLPNRQRNGARSYYYIVYYLRSMYRSIMNKFLLYIDTQSPFWSQPLPLSTIWLMIISFSILDNTQISLLNTET